MENIINELVKYANCEDTEELLDSHGIYELDCLVYEFCEKKGYGIEMFFMISNAL